MPNRAKTEQGPGSAPRLCSPSATPRVQAIAVHDPAVLHAILPYALAQAKRHHEPVSLLCVAVDRFAAIAALNGRQIADDLVGLAAATLRGMLRASDVVARLDDGRLVVLLPDAGPADAQRLAETARNAIAEAGRSTRTLPPLTTSIGVSSYPAHAHDAHTLTAAAAEAAAAAERHGRDRVVAAAPSAVGPRLAAAPCAS